MARGSYKSMPDMSKIRVFTEEEVNIIKEGFDIFDHGKQLTDLAEIIEFLDGINAYEKYPTVYHLILKISETFPKGANFKTFIETFQNLIGNNNTKVGLQKLFEAIDYEEKEFLDKQRLSVLAKEIGEKVSDEDLEYLIEEGYNCPNGKVDSDAFIKTILKVTSK
jgi:Ca2+-binding EF-hand superfamily protein